MFYDKYRQLCGAVGKSPSAAAVEMGISKGTVSTWKNLGRTPQTAQLKKIADYFGVSIDYLLGNTEDAYDWDADPDARLASVYGLRWDLLMEKHHGDASAAWAEWQDIERDQAAEAAKGQKCYIKKNAPAAESCEDDRLPAGAVRMNACLVAPLLGTVRAGLPMYAEENIEGYLPIRQSDGARYFWLNIKGDSMNAAGLEEGDQILVREQPEVENGELAVVMVNGDAATVKFFRREGDLVILTPRSFNPAHQPQIYDLKKTPVRVAGLVVECRKTFH
nr:MAG TPA: SOS-response transcriptional repressors (RecA-mediated autopeptidases) [Caudoviricetes sp.]